VTGGTVTRCPLFLTLFSLAIDSPVVFPARLALGPARQVVTVQDLALHGVPDGLDVRRIKVERGSYVLVIPGVQMARRVGNAGLAHHVRVHGDNIADPLTAPAGDGTPLRIGWHVQP
jgi:hypothetical protein